ncbi:MAG TPA: alpha/beta hydrolase [Tepidisphaeraceae bacterium]|jgi:acetyl esterase/lipase
MRFVQLAVLLCACTLAGCTKFDVLNALVPCCGYRRTTDQIYGSLPRQKLDVYRPKHAPAISDVVIFFYGGDWQSGEKSDYRFVGQALASRGFIAVLPNYRLYPQVQFPTFVEDGALAVRWVHDNIQSFGGDPRHVYLMGHSAGAHIAALLTLDAEYLKAVGLDRSDIRATAGLAGPYDFTPHRYDWGVFGMSEENQTPSPHIEPIHYADGREPPMLLVQGLKDKTVNPDNAIRLAGKIRGAGGTVELIEYPKIAHVPLVLSLAWPFRWLAPTLHDTAVFFHEHR